MPIRMFNMPDRDCIVDALTRWYDFFKPASRMDHLGAKDVLDQEYEYCGMTRRLVVQEIVDRNEPEGIPGHLHMIFACSAIEEGRYEWCLEHMTYQHDSEYTNIPVVP